MKIFTAILACLWILVLAGFALFSSPQIDFKNLVLTAEENLQRIQEARNAALNLDQPTTIYLPEGIMIDVLGIEDGKPVYAVMTNLAHPSDGGYTAFYEQISEQFDLSNARIHYGSERVVRPNVGFPTERNVAPGDSLLLIPDWTGDRVMAFDYSTGDLVDTNFVPSNSALLSSPKEARVSPWGTISVSDQIEDVVQEFDTSGAHLRILAPVGGSDPNIMDNLRGHAYRPNGNLVVTVASGTNDDAVVEFDSAGNYLGNFVAIGSGGLSSPFGVWFRENDVLVSGSGSAAVHRYDLTGTYLDNFASVSSWPQQVVEFPDSNVGVANFSGQQGVMVFSPTGQFIRLLSGATGNRGVWQLGNGNILTTNSGGVYELNPLTGSLIRTVLSGVNAQYINLYVPAVQAPANPAVILTAKIGGDSQYRSFWVNGSWDANGNWDPNWTGPLVELKDDGTPPDAVAGDTYFTGTVQLAVDSNNTYNWWTGSENDVNSFLEDGVGFDVLSTDTVYSDTLTVDGDGGINEWVIALPGDHNGWNNADDMTRGAGTVWNKAVQLTAGTHAYKYAVMHQWSAAYGDGGVGGGFPDYTVNIPKAGTYFFAFDDSDNSQSVTPASQSFVAYLDGDQQNPPVTTTGTGTGTFALNSDSTILMYEITIQNLTGNIVASHFHNAPAGTNGGVVKTIFSGSAGTDTTFSGMWTSTDSEPLTPALVHELLAGNLYINVHTTQHGSGEIRGQVFPEAPKLLLSEFVVTPTEGEFVEIYNPGADSVDLSNYYLTDATFQSGNTYYYQIVEGGGGGGGFDDWHAIFPDSAKIGPGEYQTVALAGDSAFFATYGVMPTYELWDDGHANPADAPDMREAFIGSINNQGGMTNGDEVIILYHWNGISDLVQDVDYIIYDDASPGINEQVDKTGILIDGPDVGTDSAMYRPDTPIGSQVTAPSPSSGFSTHRIDYTEGAQTMSGGNGVTGADETSEDLNNTFTNNSLPSPNESEIIVGIKDGEAVPKTFDISQNYPNPFNPSTVIKYQIPQATNVSINIYNLLGQKVRTLVSDFKEPGFFQAEWNGLNESENQVASGIYIYRIQAADFVKSRKMILLK